MRSPGADGRAARDAFLRSAERAAGRLPGPPERAESSTAHWATRSTMIAAFRTRVVSSPWDSMGRGAIPNQLQVLAAGAFALVVVVFGYTAWDRSQRGPIVISTDATLVSIVVEIRGEVRRPGVYTLDGDGRVGELIELAGGVTAQADLRQVSLARRLSDGELVMIPTIGVATPSASPVSTGESSAASVSRIDVNRASAVEMETLPGIGEVLAERIVAYREANGPFARVEDLGRVEGISDGLVEDIRDLITVGP